MANIRWTPSGTTVIATSTTTPTIFTQASNLLQGTARVINIDVAGSSAVYVGVVSAAATIGESQRIPVTPFVDFYVTFGPNQRYIIVSQGSAQITPGYAQP